VSGEIDAYFGARKPKSVGKGQVRRLFPDARAEERAWFQRTGIYPMMHTIVVREPVLERHPWVAESLVKAFDAAKRWSLEQTRFSGTNRYMLPWLQDDLDEIDELFGGDPYPYGLEPNRTALEALAGFLAQQRFLPEAPKVDDLFAPLVIHNE
jgi:4,5-dihydroxyphthalate decarboxylase